MLLKNYRAIALSSALTASVLFTGCTTENETTTDSAGSALVLPVPVATVEIKKTESRRILIESEAGLNDQSRWRIKESAKVTGKAKPALAVESIARAQTFVANPSGDVYTVPREERENYAPVDSHAVVRVVDQPVSTFSVDVDTGSYSNVRRFLNGGQLPPADAVRIEELINYFSYAYAGATKDTPFAIATEMGRTPWNDKTRLLHIGLKGYAVDAASIPAANLVFLLDVSGSMDSPHKLDLLKSSIRMLSKRLNRRDRVSMVVYAGASGVVLEPTPGDDFAAIDAALNKLRAGGSTNGQAGIQQAYAMARKGFINGGVNRIILATDGDFNVGLSDVEQLKKLIERERRSGVALTTLGFGMGNYNDHLMEQLADVGDGAYAYIDTLNEARKVLSDELTATLLTIARDVKIQVEFNPTVVSEYRLLGYENRRLENEDFSNDKVDAGEIGAGHTVTAIYEVALHGEGGERHTPLHYSNRVAIDSSAREVARVRLRYKRPGEDKSRLIEKIVVRSDMIDSLDATSGNFRFAASVAAFGQWLRDSKYLEDYNLQQLVDLANSARGDDVFGYRAEFLQLVRLADSLADSPGMPAHAGKTLPDDNEG